MRLVKTTGGTNGAPAQCRCGNKHFARSGAAWHCTACGIYTPANLDSESLKINLEKLRELGNSHFVRQQFKDLAKE